MNQRFQQVAEDFNLIYIPSWGPPKGRNTNTQPFVNPTKGVKKSEAPHTDRQLTTVCVYVVFHRNFSSAGGTDQLYMKDTQHGY
jgi:hypothetical protein